MTRHILLIGTGPSADDMCLDDYSAESCKIATVNGGIDIAPNPDYYAVVENPAIIRYREHIERLQQTRCVVFSKQNAAEKFEAHSGYSSGMVLVPDAFGGDHLRKLHKDRPYPQEEGGESWMSVGVFMLHCLAAIVRPEVIRVIGLDGYDFNERYSADIKYRPERKPFPFYQHMNAHMSDAIRVITNEYTDTKFIWETRPNHYSNAWNVEIEDE